MNRNSVRLPFLRGSFATTAAGAGTESGESVPSGVIGVKINNLSTSDGVCYCNEDRPATVDDAYIGPGEVAYVSVRSGSPLNFISTGGDAELRCSWGTN